MSKIGRNDSCPCGSGEKYKHCHLNSDDPLPGEASNKEPLKMDFNDFVQKYNTKQILGTLSALQLHPENHGRNFRFEQLCRQTLLHFDPDDNKQLAPWEVIKEVVENYSDHAYMEDPLTNPFTEIAIFEEGNYLVFSGLYSGFTRVLNHLLECIFLMHHEFPEDFKKSLRDAAGLLLFISDSAARAAGHEPFIFMEGENDNIDVPDFETVKKYRDANLFP